MQLASRIFMLLQVENRSQIFKSYKLSKKVTTIHISFGD